MKTSKIVNGVWKDYEGTKEQVQAALIADGFPDPFPAPPPPAPRQQAVSAFNALPDEVRTPFLPAWVVINQLLDLSGSADAVKYFDTLEIPAGLEQVAADIRAKLAAI